MFRFSMDKDGRYDTNTDQLVTAGITEDEDYGRRLQDTGEFRDDERYYRTENKVPKSMEDAVTFVQGVFFHAPNRVWIDGEVHEVTERIAASVRKPTAPQ